MQILKQHITVFWIPDLDLEKTVVILGQGVVGLLLTQLFRKAGAFQILTIDKYPKRYRLSLKVGADLCLNSLNDNIPEVVKELTRGSGVDLVVEASGSPEALNLALKVVADQSTIIVVSWYGPKAATLFLGEEFHRNRLKIKSSQVSRLNPALMPRWDIQRRKNYVLNLLPELKLKELITHIYPFEEAAQAFEKIDQHPEEVVQVILKY